MMTKITFKSGIVVENDLIQFTGKPIELRLTAHAIQRFTERFPEIPGNQIEEILNASVLLSSDPSIDVKRMLRHGIVLAAHLINEESDICFVLPVNKSECSSISTVYRIQGSKSLNLRRFQRADVKPSVKIDRPAKPANIAVIGDQVTQSLKHFLIACAELRGMTLYPVGKCLGDEESIFLNIIESLRLEGHELAFCLSQNQKDFRVVISLDDLVGLREYLGTSELLDFGNMLKSSRVLHSGQSMILRGARGNVEMGLEFSENDIRVTKALCWNNTNGLGLDYDKLPKYLHEGGAPHSVCSPTSLKFSKGTRQSFRSGRARVLEELLMIERTVEKNSKFSLLSLQWNQHKNLILLKQFAGAIKQYSGRTFMGLADLESHLAEIGIL